VSGVNPSQLQIESAVRKSLAQSLRKSDVFASRVSMARQGKMEAIGDTLNTGTERDSLFEKHARKSVGNNSKMNTEHINSCHLEHDINKTPCDDRSAADELDFENPGRAESIT